MTIFVMGHRLVMMLGGRSPKVVMPAKAGIPFFPENKNKKITKWDTRWRGYDDC